MILLADMVLLRSMAPVRFHLFTSPIYHCMYIQTFSLPGRCPHSYPFTQSRLCSKLTRGDAFPAHCFGGRKSTASPAYVRKNIYKHIVIFRSIGWRERLVSCIVRQENKYNRWWFISRFCEIYTGPSRRRWPLGSQQHPFRSACRSTHSTARPPGGWACKWGTPPGRTGTWSWAAGEPRRRSAGCGRCSSLRCGCPRGSSLTWSLRRLGRTALQCPGL